MMYQHSKFAIFFCVAIAISFAGCGASSDKTASSSDVETSGPPSTVESGHDHAHPSEGPHGGSLIELGNEEYHAELVHDEQSGSVTVYILDATAKTSVPIEATEALINLKHDGRGEQFKLAASADPTDAPGKSSRFVSTDAELTKDLDHEGAGAELVVTINGKPYRGELEHEHDHEDHDHKNE